MSAQIRAITLSELTARLGAAIAMAPGVNDVWVTGETSDLRVSRGHCYLDLIEKGTDGTQKAKMRAMIWARDFGRLAASFEAATGSPLRSDLKIMVRVRTTFHPLFGLSLTVTDINPEFTVGDMVRRRNEILSRLQAEGVYDLNRSLPWPVPALRIAIISAAGAAGYGDFVRQLYSSPARIRFTTELFEAPMQGAQTSPGIIAALEAVAAVAESFDCVAIIRGGGAVADLVAFDDYNLAAHVAQFPLPVIVGIGHERDICALDYIAARSLRTPTAAAEYLVSLAEGELSRLRETALGISRAVTERTRAAHALLARSGGELPLLVRGVLERACRRVSPEVGERLAEYALGAVARRRERLDAIAGILDALSPQATLRRGFSVTRVGGQTLTDASQLLPGEVIETLLAEGKIYSTVLSKDS